MLEKIKNIKMVKALLKRVKRVKKRLLASFEDTYYGSVISSVFVLGILGMGILYLYIPVIPRVFCFVFSVVLAILAGELIGILIRLFFGMKKRNRIYWFMQFILIFAVSSLAAGSDFFSCLLFSLVSAFLAGLLGRCLWSVLRRKRHTLLALLCLICSVTGLSAVIFYLGGEGSKKSYIDRYVSMAEKDAMHASQAFSAGSTERGEFEAGTFTYGMSAGSDIASDTFDLSAFAEQGAIDKMNKRKILGYDLSNVPLEGKIWYPQGEKQCPVLFLIHGNHEYTVASYLGYDYLGEYLASFGYVTVSVNENICNLLSDENDARAVLLLENMKYILDLNRNPKNALYGMIDEERIAVSGHSRGGEAVSTAYLFNSYDSYPEDGNIKFSYHYNIASIIEIAPTVDQYQPAGHSVVLEDVNFLVIQGANDQDVTQAAGQKQYYNVLFTEDSDRIKSMLYVSGANHGQFNSRWGRCDSSYPVQQFLNTANLLNESEQQEILKCFLRIFLDVTLKQDKTMEGLLKDCCSFRDGLPRTVYQQIYQTSAFTCLADFEEDSDLNTAGVAGARIETANLSEWTEEKTVFGAENTKENYAMKVAWQDTREAEICFTLPEQNLTDRALVFDLADIMENEGMEMIDGTVTIEDQAGNEASVRISAWTPVYPTLPVQLGKLDFVFGNYEYTHPFQTVTIPGDAFLEENPNMDLKRIVKIGIIFDYRDYGMVWLDNIGLE